MFDRVDIYVKAGDGGGGCNSFRGKKFTRMWHPDGGRGGKGADIIIKVDKNIQTLKHLQYNSRFRAEDGKSGEANKKKGADGRPCIIKVPPGTIIRDQKNNLLLRDLTVPDEELVIAKGGEGGKGNTKARTATKGLPGEQKRLSLELKFVADIVIIGYPNSGKSSFLSRVSSARPKIAAYPFTTTSPFLGVCNFSDFEEPDSLTVVEIPGLIKGSHQGKGIGAQFLRHAERAKILVHLIDMSTQKGRRPAEDYYNLNKELNLYSEKLFRKKQILVANKMDLPEAKTNLNEFCSKIKAKIYPISCATGRGIEELLSHLRGYFQ